MHRRTRRAAFFILFVVVLGALSCKDSPTAPRATLNGSWDGFIMRVGAVLVVTLTDSDGLVTGDGHATGYMNQVPVTVEGTFEPPNFTLTFNSPGLQPFVYEGTATTSRMNGMLNGSGFSDDVMVLNKK